MQKKSLTNPGALVSQLRLQYPTQTSAEIAEACGIKLSYEKLPLAFGRMIYFAEVFFQPPKITVNLTAVAKLAEGVSQVPEEQRTWLTQETITNIVIAHELYHILTQQPSGKGVEAAAHDFAQQLTRLSFSPLVYETILKKLTT